MNNYYDQNNRGWTTVSYGRRQGRPRQRDWVQGAPWRKDRAPSATFKRRRSIFPYPNRPVPPPGPRYLGPQSRSYAAVARQNNSRPAFRFTAPGGNRPQNNRVPFLPPGGNRPQTNRDQYIPPDPAFSRLARKMHSVIKQVHHLQNVAVKPGKAEPRMISNMVETLTTMIKPAAPTPNTSDLIMGNARNWGYTTLLILEQHYMEGLEATIKEISSDLTGDWKAAFQVATKWARKNLSRLTQEVIDHAEALLTTYENGQAVSDTEQQPAPPQATQRKQHAQHNTQHTPQRTEQVGAQAPRRNRAKNTVTAGTDTETDRLGVTALPTTQLSPKQRRTKRRLVRQNTCVVSENSSALEIDSSDNDWPIPPRARRCTRPLLEDSPLDTSDGLEADTTPNLIPLQTAVAKKQVVSAMVHQLPVLQKETATESSDVEDLLLDLTPTPEPPKCRVTRHINTNRKLVDWELTVFKKWLIIGDSNLSKIPPYSIPDLQIESYPGANFRNAQAIMAKVICKTVVEKVVLSFGINCRGQKAKMTSVKQMQSALRTAKLHFPYSEIWIPMINFSSALPVSESSCLRTLNEHIRRNMPYLIKLEDKLFSTESDNIHWTKTTAQAMLVHWSTILNFRAPRAF